MGTNFYAGNCSVCNESVPARAGTAEPPSGGSRRWTVKCNKCAGIVADAKPRIGAKSAGPNVAFAPISFLGGDVFQTYRVATTGCQYDPATKSQVISGLKASGIIKALREASFVVEMTPELAGSLQAMVAAAQEEVIDAGSRAGRVDQALRERGLALFPFQKVGVTWLASRQAGLLADDMGLGKTIQALTAMPENAPILVIGPAVAKYVWATEAKKWRPDLKVTMLEGRKSFKWPAPGEMVVTNYDIIDSPTTAPAPGTVVIADEAQCLKNSKTQRTSRFRDIGAAARNNGGKTWILTATPLMNRPGELWSVLQAAGIAREAFGSWENFVRLFDGVQDRWGAMVWGTPDPSVPELLRKVSLRREKKDVLPDLPEKRYREIIVDLDEKTRKACMKAASVLETYTRFNAINGDPTPEQVRSNTLKTSREDMVNRMGEDVVHSVEEADRILKQMVSLNFEDMSRARAALATAKIPALIKLVEEYEEQEEPVVVFSAHRAPIDAFASREGWRVITGDTPAEERVEIQQAFQDGKLKGVAGTIDSAGTALTLTRASNAIFVDLEWTPALNTQAEDRILRIGQTRGVLITILVANFPLDQRVTALLQTKKRIIQKSIEASAVLDNSQVEINLPEGLDVGLFDMLSKEAAEEQAREEAARKAAEERAKEFAGKRAQSQAEAEEERKRARRKAREDRWTSEAKETQESISLPRTKREQWVANSLQLLAEQDPDRAQFKNDVGFSASDGGIGHRFAFLSNVVGLTDQQWALALGLCRKYHRQVGAPPA